MLRWLSCHTKQQQREICEGKDLKAARSSGLLSIMTLFASAMRKERSDHTRRPWPTKDVS